MHYVRPALVKYDELRQVTFSHRPEHRDGMRLPWHLPTAANFDAEQSSHPHEA